jgi:RNA polymerase sigma-70 factor (ECF subfamily)
MYGEAQARSDALRVAIAQLPRGQREAIEMLKLRQLSLREASAVTGSSVGALKVATHRAMTTLRALLKKT